MEEIIINGKRVAHEKDVEEGIKYLMFKISDLEAKVFFDQAYKFGFAMFQDRLRHKFKLSYHDGKYALEKQ